METQRSWWAIQSRGISEAWQRTYDRLVAQGKSKKAVLVVRLHKLLLLSNVMICSQMRLQGPAVA